MVPGNLHNKTDLVYTHTCVRVYMKLRASKQETILVGALILYERIIT